MNSLLSLRGCSRALALTTFSLCLSRGASGQGSFVPNGQDLFVLDLAGTPVGGFPSGISVLNGGMTVVDKDGQRMLRASSPSEFLIRFPQALPQNFTVEFDFIPKACCNPEDLSLEGTPTINRGTGSAHVVWHREILSVVGGGTYYQAAMPEDLKQATPGTRTQVVVMFEGTTVKLYTNGRRLYTLSDRKFVRGGVLRVYLGGQDDNRHAVYLAGLRVAAGTGALGIVAATPAVPTQPTAPPGAGSAPPQPPTQVTPQLPVVGPSAPNPQTASSSQASTGGPTPTVVANVTVTQGLNGPIVSWLAVAAPAVYTVQRWLVGNPACCNNTSPASPALTGPPWQDSPPPLSGTYVYQVTALTNAGTATGQTQFAYLSTGGGQIVAPAGAPSSGPRTVTTVPTAPTAPSAPVGASGGPVSTGFSVSVTMGASGPVVTWPLLTNATGYAVNRSKSDDPNCCNANSGRSWLVASTWQDQALPMVGSYLYIVTAVTPGGQVQAQTQFDFSAGATPISALPPTTPTGTVTPIAPSPPAPLPTPGPRPGGTPTVLNTGPAPPAPRDPASFTATQSAPDQVQFEWDFVSGVTEYLIAGPGTGNGISVVGKAQQIGTKNSYSLSGVPPGTHTWTIAAIYQPGGILTQPSQWPTATLTMVATGKYEISVESVKATSEAGDDLFNGDGLRNEFYVTALVRTKDQAGSVLRESSYRSATHGDITNWPPPARVRAGNAGANGGVMDGDLVGPIWDQPTAGATGWSRLVLWTGTLTAGVETVDVVPAIWESDNAWPRSCARCALPGLPYEDWLRLTGYYFLDLSRRTAYGDISNVMLADEDVVGTRGGKYWMFYLNTPGDRPVGIAKEKQDPLFDVAYWIPFAISVNLTVAEAALSGAYGPPGLIPIQLVDHKRLSMSPITHPDLGRGNYTLNIRITRLP